MADVEAEDRTQAPSKLRLQQARERGMVAHSPELTGAAALLAATLMLGVVGESLATGLLTVVRGPWMGRLDLTLDAASVVDHLRATAWAVLRPLGLLMLGLVAAGIAAHQAQVGLLWTPALMAPDLARLGGGVGRGFAARAGRGAWSLAKSLAVLAVAAWAIRSRFDGLAGLGTLDTPALARVWAEAVRGLLATLAASALVLGLIDYAMQRGRFATMLRLTPGQSREDQKSMDGDPSLRGRRLRLARAWRGDAPELLAGASLAVVGPNGLIVVLADGPPPAKVSVRSAADGATGTKLRRTAEQGKIATVERPELARQLARLASKPNQTLTPEILADLAAVWPAK